MTFEFSVYAMSYLGLLYDLLVGVLLLWNPTFWIGILATIFFHCSNKLVFNIGIFPYVMIASTSLFFRSDWPTRVVRLFIYKKDPYTPVADTAVRLSNYIPPKKRKSMTLKQKIVMIGAILFMIYWVLMPIRFLVMPGEGPQCWHENAHMVL